MEASKHTVGGGGVWDKVVLLIAVGLEKETDPLQWALHLSSCLRSAEVSLPSIEVAEILVDHICGDHNVPIMWKFLEKAMAFSIVPPLIVLALLSTRVIPKRGSRPSAYKLYMELLKRHAFAFKSQINAPNYGKVMRTIDSLLHLTQIFGLNASEPGVLVVEYIFSILWQLLDASLEDEGLMELLPEKESIWVTKSDDMEIHCYDDKKIFRERLKSLNTTMAIEMIGQFLDGKVTSKLLYLARCNLPKHWVEFVGALELLGNSPALRTSKAMTSESLRQLVSYDRVGLSRKRKTSSPQKIHAIMAFGVISSSAGLYHKDSLSGFWLPLDLILEDAMDGYQVSPTSSVEMIKGLIKDLQAINNITWHDTFLGLWMSALRLVQRERDPIEGPVPRLDARLCMLLCITTLVAADLIDEEENRSCSDSPTSQWNDHDQQVIGHGQLRKDLISSLQMLGDYHGLLIPPHSSVSVANQAAAKAMMSVSGSILDNGHLECVNVKDLPFSCSGNLRHLIVEACIARNLLDTTAYFWPGYVNGQTQINEVPHTIPSQVPSWSTFKRGTPLTPPLIRALVSTPASSLADLEKVYEIAVKGTNDEKISAATILCGASLNCGWNVQEHTARCITSLLAPPVPENYSGNESHLIGFAPMFNVLIIGIGSIDCVQIFSLLGLVPELAASLMPICEILGSCVPNVVWTLPTGEAISAHAVFSNAFTLLLKLWRFNHPPLEYSVGDVPPVGSHLTPEYLLLLRNANLLTCRAKTSNVDSKLRNSFASTSSSAQPVFLDSFPKLRAWYRQHLACIASTLSGLVHGTPVHQIVDTLLNMMFRRINRGQPVVSVTSGSSSSSGTTLDDASLRPNLPAWDILEAVPFVVDASLTACGNGRLSPRELATGLKDLADFLPASLATIISYFSAEVTRGLWKPVFMNGTDWPSPAANLANVEEKITKILAATGVDVPTIATAGESSPATLPLPLAAFVSLTITYKIDKASERFLNLAGPALEVLAAGCPWPCMPIVASLWTLKAKRWSDFLVFSASRTVFLHNNDSIVQLLKSCFSATLGLNGSPITSNGGVGALLGHGYVSHFGGGISPVAPGILYLRVYRSLKEIMFIMEEILSILMQSVIEIATNGFGRESLDLIRKSKLSGQCRQVSLAQAMTKAKLAASLAASLVWLSGGLGLVQSLIKETLPSWFISVHRLEKEEDSGGIVAMLGGYVLAYFTMLCGSFAWGIDSSSSASKRRPNIIGKHMSFLASALDGKISLGCDPATWHAYVTGFVSLMVSCTPAWVREVDSDLLKRVSGGLRQWNEEELALSLLGVGGIGTMGAAAELMIETD